MHGSAVPLLLSSSSSTLSASWTRREPSTNLLPTALRQRLCRRSSLPGACCSLVAGIALVIGWHERLAALLLALFLIPATLTAHDVLGVPRP